MTEAIPATPGWVDERLETIFAGVPAAARAATEAFATCLAASKAPAAPSDLLGAEFQPCHAHLRQALMHAGMHGDALADIMRHAEALEAEIAADS